MIWRTVRRFLRRHGLWPKAAMSPERRSVRPWAVSHIAPGMFCVEYERGRYSVAVLISGVNQAQRARLRRAIRRHKAQQDQARDWLARRELEPVQEYPSTRLD